MYYHLNDYRQACFPVQICNVCSQSPYMLHYQVTDLKLIQLKEYFSEGNYRATDLASLKKKKKKDTILIAPALIEFLSPLFFSPHTESALQPSGPLIKPSAFGTAGTSREHLLRLLHQLPQRCLYTHCR